jgi:hypothetical protein
MSERSVPETNDFILNGQQVYDSKLYFMLSCNRSNCSACVWSNLRQRERNQIAAGSNGEVLLAIHRVTHGRCVKGLPNVEVP